tara:strand:- start:4623 stop:4910 length:288 start_codon:yes stop_codon:yes gene_type:complete
MKIWKFILSITIIGSLCTITTNAQNSCDSDGWILPCNKKNTRFTSDYFNIPRPALSLRGFDNTAQDNFDHSQDSKVFGVRQLLENLYDSAGLEIY